MAAFLGCLEYMVGASVATSPIIGETMLRLDAGKIVKAEANTVGIIRRGDLDPAVGHPVAGALDPLDVRDLGRRLHPDEPDVRHLVDDRRDDFLARPAGELNRSVR
jgi:hypothetical protein